MAHLHGRLWDQNSGGAEVVLLDEVDWFPEHLWSKQYSLLHLSKPQGDPLRSEHRRRGEASTHATIEEKKVAESTE